MHALGRLQRPARWLADGLTGAMPAGLDLRVLAVGVEVPAHDADDRDGQSEAQQGRLASDSSGPKTTAKTMSSRPTGATKGHSEGPGRCMSSGLRPAGIGLGTRDRLPSALRCHIQARPRRRPAAEGQQQWQVLDEVVPDRDDDLGDDLEDDGPDLGEVQRSVR